jgi:hypothetical protein
VNVKNNFYLGLAALDLFQDRATYQPLNGRGVALSGKFGLNFSAVVDLLDHPEAGPSARHEFKVALLRMVLKESFEVVLAFAEDHARVPVLRSQPWYHTARMLRNCGSHDFKLAFRPHDRGLLPVEWNGLTITAETDGEYLTTQQSGPAFVKELVNEFEKFIRRLDPGPPPDRGGAG